MLRSLKLRRDEEARIARCIRQHAYAREDEERRAANYIPWEVQQAAQEAAYRQAIRDKVTTELNRLYRRKTTREN